MVRDAIEIVGRDYADRLASMLPGVRLDVVEVDGVITVFAELPDGRREWVLKQWRD